MRQQTIEFVAQESVMTMVPTQGAFRFNPKGRAQWVQRLAWRFLNWRGAMDQAHEPSLAMIRHTIDSDKFIDRLLKQKYALFDGFHKEGQRLIIGSEDYADLMASPEITPYHFNFRAEVGVNRKILGLAVEVVPWMRGAVVMP